MEEIYKKSLLLIHSLTQLNGICNKFSKEPNDETGDKIVEIVEKCEKKFLKVKEEIVIMVKEIETKEQQSQINNPEVSAIKTEGGFLINKEK